MIDSAGRLVFTNWDHLDRDPEAVTDSRNGDPNPPYNEPFTRTLTYRIDEPDLQRRVLNWVRGQRVILSFDPQRPTYELR